MSDDEINKAIAEACGYTGIRYDWINGSDAIKDWMHDKGRGIPNYCNSLNAMHDAEKLLANDNTLGGLVEYANKLMRICGSHAACIHATARQRAEAFLCTVSKKPLDATAQLGVA